jgi:hypothetical protein
MFKNLKIHILIIFFAYRNVLLEWRDMLDPKKRKVFNERMEICNRCDMKDEIFNVCSVCKCPLKPKTRGDYDLDEEGKSIFGCPYRYW